MNEYLDFAISIAKYDTLEIAKILRDKVKTCQLGSTAHASMLVAKGTISVEIFPGTSHGHCDIAANKLTVEESVGKVTYFNGVDQRYDKNINKAILTNGIMYKVLIKTINEIYKVK